MSPRILCLHGMGINSQIFDMQTAPFRNLLSEDYEFIFVDGPMTCAPAPNVGSVYPGPYLCWYKTPDTNSVKSAHRYIAAIMQEEGPFDGVLGFSQGAAVAASMILHRQLEDPRAPHLFKFAIFIGSPLPFSFSPQYGIDTRLYFGVPSLVNCTQLRDYQRPTKVPKHLITPDRYLKRDPEDQESADDDEETLFSVKVDCVAVERRLLYQMFHSTADDVRMAIPTVHIFGRQDPWYLHSKDVLDLACPHQALVLDHIYGHEVPKQLSEEICDLIETVVDSVGTC